MEFRVLGPVEVCVEGRVLEVGPPQQRLVVAALAMDTGRPVTVESLIDRVWDEAPGGARRTLHVLITRVRRLLEQASADGQAPGEVLRRSGGYVLQVDPDRVDAHLFRRLVQRSRDPGCPDGERVGLLRQALGLWRGEPLSGLPGQWAARTREAWRQQHLDAMVAWAHAELQVGNPIAVVGPLTDLAGEHPLVESLTAALMRALYAAGRPSDALDHYAKIRQRLVDELGADPGVELRQIHQAILRNDLDPPRPSTGPRAVAVPAQLPLDVFGFAGRGDELADLDAILAKTADQPTAVVISALSGTAGVGKTALAVHWAHRVVDRFPDGQLYVNLRGYDPRGAAMAPAEAVRGFLDAFAVPPERIPDGIDAQVGLYRSLLAGRRVLVVLDNARDAEQIRPLLPGSPTTFVVVTSRDQLSSLVAAEGAQSITLDLLPPGEARELLANRLGPDRVAAEAQAAEEIAVRCARLPLALSIAAAHAAGRPAVRLAALAVELCDHRGGLDAFDGGDSISNVRVVFSWSYRTLSPAAARLFRLLGLHAGPHIATSAAASLAGVPVSRVRPVLTELTRAHLLTEHASGRYAFHDLLRAYASELAGAVDAEANVTEATRRLLDHYLQTAYAADRLVFPHREPIIPNPPQPDVTIEVLRGRDSALAWFTAEHPVLVAAVDQAAAAGFDTHAWHLAWAILDYLDRWGHWQDQAATQLAAIAAARRVRDRGGQALSHRGLGRAYARLGRLDQAGIQLRCAVELFDELGNPAGQARTHLSLAVLAGRQRRYPRALHHARQALDLFRVVGYRTGEGNALNTAGWYHAQLGEHRQAIACCRQALSLLGVTGDRYGQAGTWDSLGYAYHQLGDHEQATTCYHNAIDLHRQAGDRHNEADALTHLGDNHHAAGRPAAARDSWRRALDILDELDHPGAEQVRARLDGALR